MAIALSCAALSACISGTPADSRHAPAAGVAATFSVADAQLPAPLVLVAYGDMRFTDPNASQLSQPVARRALLAKIAAESPAAVLIDGDLPLRGDAEDYRVFHSETAPWRDRALRVYPALGNHEFAGCAEAACLDLWWSEFPALRGRRWYSVSLGSQVLCIVLDSDASLMPGSGQRAWLEAQVGGRGPAVKFVLIVMHHPPLADVQTVQHVDHNPRANEASLAEYLGKTARATSTRFLVIAGHIHNYERFERDGVVYLVSGGGGAAPYEVERTAGDLFRRNGALPNYHYVRLELANGRLKGEMIRLSDYADAAPHDWDTLDRFEISPRR